MRRFLSCLPLLMLAALTAWPGMAPAQIHRCTIDGTVTFQREPCPSKDTRKPPSAAELNAARPQAADPAPHRTGNWDNRAATSPAPSRADAAPAPNAAGGFRCDGRIYCSQMTSCEEARYFVANCPGVRMDGNRDGNPCQRQWCGR